MSFFLFSVLKNIEDMNEGMEKKLHYNNIKWKTDLFFKSEKKNKTK
jgi:hypothetical protein